MPSDVRSRARMDQWMLVEQCYFSDASMKISMQKLLHPNPDPQVIQQGRDGVATALDAADRRLGQVPYFAGETFSLADSCWMPYVGYLFPAEAGDLVESRPQVAAWWARISSRPSWKKVAG